MQPILDFPREKDSDDRKFIEALARGLDVLRAFGPGSGLLGNQEIASRTGLPKPTVSRLTYTLTKLGYLSYSPQLEKYQLDVGVLALGYSFLSNLRVRQVAKPLMELMAKRTKTAITLNCRDRLSMISVETVRDEETTTLRLDVGSRVPLATSASGRAYLAALPENDRDFLLQFLEERAGDEWPVIRKGIDQALKDYTEKGYCVSIGDWDRSVNAVAVPLQLQDGTLMALGCGGPSYLVSQQMIEDQLCHQLIHLAREIQAVAL
ncbi:transcriptional regulator [Marinobacterium nitratireducens]|uniref:Transcriptional regulator n=2 Tax=Marinobacterium nitratireducens TaxID=518897 RepID=A0A918DSM6_9GAMM|nr:transcriptional regulator [Marinobacterium nitratireducens]